MSKIRAFFKKKPDPQEEKNLALQEFARSIDRGPAKYFVGRTEIINEITEDLQKCIRNQGKVLKNWNDQTTVLQGAPGAGKSALLNHLETWLPETIKSKKSVQICLLDPKDLREESRWQKKITEALKPGSRKKMEISTSTQIQGSVNAKVVQAGRKTTQQAQSLTWDQLLTEHKEDPTSFHPVVLMIDEIQNIQEHGQSTIAETLEYFHKGTDQIPVFPIYGGLSHSHDKLKSLGLSRLSKNRVITLPTLSDEECQSAVTQFLEDPDFGIQCNETDKKYWQDTIAEQASGWPQHLTICLTALAEEIAKDPAHRAENADAGKILENIHENKEKYYQNRLSHTKLQYQRKLAAAGVLLTNRHPNTEIPDLGGKLEKIAEHMGIKEDRFRLPKNQDGKQFAIAMMESGLLHKTDTGKLEVPVPSLVTHCGNLTIEDLQPVPKLQTPELLNPPLPHPELARNILTNILQKACKDPGEKKNNQVITVLCQEYGFEIPEGREIPNFKERAPIQYEKIKDLLYTRIQGEGKKLPKPKERDPIQLKKTEDFPDAIIQGKTTNDTSKKKTKEKADLFELEL